MDFMDEASTLEQTMINRAKQKKIPINGSLELLPLCNMNCDMCYVRLSREEMDKIGRLRTAEEWLKLAGQLKQAGVLFLLLTGGEPLLFPDFRRLYLELKKMGMILTINTNATLIDDDWADFFEEHKPRRVNVTLYGADRKTYERLCHHAEGFDKTIRAIRLLAERKVDVKVSFSITRENYEQMNAVFEIGEALGIPVHIDPYMMPGVRERCRPYDQQIRVLPEEAALASLRALKLQLSEEFYKQYVLQSIERVENPDFPRGNGHISCLAGNCSFTINWQGEMRPCVMLAEPSIPVFERGFQNAWREICSRTEKICINGQCTKCSHRPLCKICAAGAFLETGAYDGIPDYLCRYSKELYRLLQQEGKNYG